MALVVVALADLLVWALDLRFPWVGLVDEPAHLATGLLLLANLPSPGRIWVISFAVAIVAIDLDHLPLLFGSDALSEGTGRPYAHSLVTVALLVVVGAAWARAREIAFGVAAGVLAHFLRDLATGGGVSLLWPVSTASTTIPYAVYAAVLTVLAVRLWALGGRAAANSRA